MDSKKFVKRLRKLEKNLSKMLEKQEAGKLNVGQEYAFESMMATVLESREKKEEGGEGMEAVLAHAEQSAN